ncbi:hypothetical protein G7Y89_g9915 [Cudoniella acicularis]|uniref:Tachykinin family protein n=1 Tax=Cudoniella acicularis TaxID=354080 RepID=A0A8H4RGG6_9HELO|nr:hypothetical protein G7Y89_g9915 [Cudoniella acicularis]
MEPSTEPAPQEQLLFQRRPRSGIDLPAVDQGTSINSNKTKNTMVTFKAGEASALEFVTITGRPSEHYAENSKQVRVHAMRDYIRKSKNGADAVIAVKNVHPEEPSRYKGRFRLNTTSHNSKSKAKPKTRATPKSKDTHPRRISSTPATAIASQSKDLHGDTSDQDFQKEDSFGYQQSPKRVSFLGHWLDPFNTLAVQLTPLSERGFYHYHTSYYMNSVAINPEGKFFSNVKEDPALFHSLLYLVTLHHDLHLGISESRESLYHGGEAFKIINERLRNDQTFSVQTITAVALLANKENLNGNIYTSKMHIQALQHMVKTKGGISTVVGPFWKSITWSDFCFANTWNVQPSFLRQTFDLQLADKIRPPIVPTMLQPEEAFGLESPMVRIFHLIRILSFDLDPDHISKLDRVLASNMIYELEYDILSLNKDPVDELALVPSHSFEVIPLKTAVHLYLYLVIRAIPQMSKAIERLVLRLQDSLKLGLQQWWVSSSECETWLLWILFIGAVASRGRYERRWFIQYLANIMSLLGIYSFEALQSHLEKVLWQEAFCANHCRSVWGDVVDLVVSEGGSLNEEEEI